VVVSSSTTIPLRPTPGMVKAGGSLGSGKVLLCYALFYGVAKGLGTISRLRPSLHICTKGSEYNDCISGSMAVGAILGGANFV
jgi:hypothetical protein